VDGQKELLVGSEDFEIRIFRGEEVLSDVTEADVVTGLCPIHDATYGYALANGSIGVYNKQQKLWGIKAKSSVEAIAGA
jgi:Bardet-Biedl syndrome 2 protein